MTRPPRFMWVSAFVVVAGLVVVGLCAWQVERINMAEGRRDCARAVASRDDARAMWLYVISSNNERRNTPEFKRFVVKLDELLPKLHCKGDNWTPVR